MEIKIELLEQRRETMILKLIIGALMIGGIYGVLGMGYCLVYKSTGLMNLAQGDFMMFGAYVGLTFYKYVGLPFPIAILLTFCVMFLIGYFIQRFMIIKLIKRGATFAYVILCTAACSMVLQNGAMIGWGPVMLSFPNIFKTTSINLGVTAVAPENLLVLGVAVVCSFGLYAFLNKTSFGTAIRAAAMDEDAAYSVGIDVMSTKGIAWGLSAGLAGVIGASIGPIYGVYTTMGGLIGQKAFAGAVAGGYGNVYGALVGGMLFGFLESFVSAGLTATYKDAIIFGVLIILLTVKPNGIFKENVIEL